MLRVKLLSERAVLPARATPGAAGFDLCAAEEAAVPARGRALIATDIAVSVPPGTYGRIAPRSGLATKHAIDVGAGVVDSDYRGAVGVLLFNHSDVPFAVGRGDRIAQLIIETIAAPDVLEVDSLDKTWRGARRLFSLLVVTGRRGVTF